jgi:outer membrane lipoprotein carrier protein
MSSRSRALATSTAGLVALRAAAPLSAEDAATALDRAERAYRATSTLTADFAQILVNPMLGDPEVTRGVLFLDPPERFAMRWTQPAGERVVADGEWLWAFAPSSVPDQVIRQSIPRYGPSSPQLIGQFVNRPLERYDARYVGEETVGNEITDVVYLVPKRDDMPFRDAEIAIGRSDGLLRRIKVTEASGQRRTLVLANLRANAPIVAAELQFEVPDGVRVVTP